MLPQSSCGVIQDYAGTPCDPGRMRDKETSSEANVLPERTGVVSAGCTELVWWGYDFFWHLLGQAGSLTDTGTCLLAFVVPRNTDRINFKVLINLILIKNNSMNSVNHCINAIVKKFKQMLTLNNSLSKWVL